MLFKKYSISYFFEILHNVSNYLSFAQSATFTVPTNVPLNANMSFYIFSLCANVYEPHVFCFLCCRKPHESWMGLHSHHVYSFHGLLVSLKGYNIPGHIQGFLPHPRLTSSNALASSRSHDAVPLLAPPAPSEAMNILQYDMALFGSLAGSWLDAGNECSCWLRRLIG